LETIVADAIEVVRPSAQAREISLRFQRPREPALLIGDPGRLQQVMWNLLSNAVKFNEPGGLVEVGLEQDGSQLVIKVVDNGKGIDPEFLPYVFDRFKQGDGSTTRRFGGLGLGLAIVRHIVELHGGRVAVESPGLGRGATFRIALPLQGATVSPQALEAAPADAESALQPTRTDLQGVRVLVLDDERDARDLLELVLGQAGAQVRTAESASAGLAALADFAPDVIVSDIGMPDEDGYSFMRRVRSMAGRSGSTPSIALTAYARGDDKQRALEMGFSSHLGKPVSPDELTALIAQLARHEA
jgi:CheY-like chemotaxis protein